MKKTVEEYMSLPYTVEITRDGDSYFVRIKELEGCMSVGNSRTDALAMIEDAMREWLTVAIEDGVDIALPEAMQTDRYSGKFPLRLPKTLHRKLSENAEKEGTSLNQYMVMLLSERNALVDVKRMLAERDRHSCDVPMVESATAAHGRGLANDMGLRGCFPASDQVHESEEAYARKKAAAGKKG